MSQGSYLEEVVNRAGWVSSVAEIVGLSHEAACRRARKTGKIFWVTLTAKICAVKLVVCPGCFHGIHHDHAEAERLSFAFIADRAQTGSLCYF